MCISPTVVCNFLKSSYKHVYLVKILYFSYIKSVYMYMYCLMPYIIMYTALPGWYLHPMVSIPIIKHSLSVHVTW